MIRFNFESIYLLTRGDSTAIVNYLKAVSSGSIKSLTGASYLVNTSVLYGKYSNQDIAEYVALASFRDYNVFKATGEKRLHKSLIPPWVPDTVVLSNPLIETSDKQFVTFIFE